MARKQSSFAPVKVEIAFTTDPTDGSPSWTDVSGYVRSVNIRRGRNHELSRAEAGTLTMRLNNADGRFDPMYTTSPYYPYVLPLRRVRVTGYYPTGVTAVDPFTSHEDLLLAQSPAMLLSMQERNGTTAADASGNGRTGTYGSGITLAQTHLTPNPDDYSVLFDNTTNGRVVTTYNPFATTSNRTFMGWAYRTDTTGADTFFGSNGASFNPRLRAQSGSADINFTPDAVASGGLNWTSVCPTATVFHWALTWNGTTKTAELFINGVSQGTKVHSVDFNASPGDILVGAYRSDFLDPWKGRQSHFSVFTSVLSGATILALFQGAMGTANIDTPTGTPYRIFTGYIERWPQTWRGATDNEVTVDAVDGFELLNQIELNTGVRSSERSDLRIEYILDEAALPSADRSLNTGQTTVADQTFDNTNALGAIQEVVEAEYGNFFFSGDGKATFHDRHARFTTFSTSQKTFSDSAPTGSTLPYKDLVVSYDKDEIRNEANVTRPGGTIQTASDSASQTKYFKRVFSSSPILTSDSEALNLALYIISLYKEPYTRVEQLTIDPRMDDNLWLPVLSYDLGTKITVVKSQPWGGTSINTDVHIEAVTHDIGKNGDRWSWKTTWDLSPAARTAYWVLGDAVNGVLGTTTRLAY